MEFSTILTLAAIALMSAGTTDARIGQPEPSSKTDSSYYRIL
jgi:hypothetical protein